MVKNVSHPFLLQIVGKLLPVEGVLRLARVYQESTTLNQRRPMRNGP